MKKILLYCLLITTVPAIMVSIVSFFIALVTPLSFGEVTNSDAFWIFFAIVTVVMLFVFGYQLWPNEGDALKDLDHQIELEKKRKELKALQPHFSM